MNMNIMRKTAALALAGTIVLSLAACGSTKASQADNTSTVQTDASQTKTTQEITDNSLGGWAVNN